MRSIGRLVVMLMVGILLFSRTGQAANFVCGAGDVSCLIAAINAANANGQANTITLAAGDYVLTAVDNDTDGPNGLPSITGKLTIVGGGAEITGITRPTLSGPTYRLIHVAATGTLALQGLTLYGGGTGGDDPSRFTTDGGGLFNAGTVTITNSTIRANRSYNGDGGGIFNVGAMTIRESNITDNHIRRAFRSGGGGCGIANRGTLIIIDSTLRENSVNATGDGGALLNTGGTVTIINSALIANGTAGDDTGSGGAIANSGGTVTILKSTLRNNIAGQNRSGGGIANFIGKVTIIDSDVSRNATLEQAGGGGIYNSATLLIVDSTISSNVTAIGGGGIENTQTGTVTITNSTVSGNSISFSSLGSLPGTSGGGILNRGGSVTLQNTILAVNTADTYPGPDCAGIITSLGHNIIGTTAGCTIALQPSDLTGDPGLASFTDDGTPGNGHFPLLPTSAAIDAAADAACPPFDQLGHPRVGHCDIGAVEFAQSVTIDIQPGGSRAPINPTSAGAIRVAILTTQSFDATTVDVNTVHFGKTGTEASPVKSDLQDINRDGAVDVILQFRASDTGIACGDGSAFVTGRTFTNVPIFGVDAIVVVGCK